MLARLVGVRTTWVGAWGVCGSWVQLGGSMMEKERSEEKRGGEEREEMKVSPTVPTPAINDYFNDVWSFYRY